MSTSSPPSAPSSSQHRPVEPSRPVPRHTYGRQRPLSPEAEDGISTSALFTSASHISPAKGLLNRWSNANTSWRDSLDDWDASDKTESRKQAVTARAKLTAFDDLLDDESDQNAEDDLEAIKKEMERMRRTARGDPALPPPVEPRAISSKSTERLLVPNRVLAGSSSLTALTESSEAPPRLFSSSSPVKHVSPHSPASSSTSVSGSDTTSHRRPSTSRRKNRYNRATMSDEDNDESETSLAISRPSILDENFSNESDRYQTSPARLARGRDDTGQDLQHFLNTLADEDKELDEGKRQGSVDTDSAKESVGLFDDDELNTKSKGQKKLKPLNMKDKQEMFKDMARAERERQVEIAKPEARRMPISSWLLQASEAVKNTVIDDMPGLSDSRHSPRTSPAQTTPPDDISAFTPSSTDAAKKAKLIVETTPAIGSSSPTPHPTHTLRHKAVIPSTSEILDDDDDGRLDLRMIIQQDDARQRAKLDLEERRKRLAEVKKRMLEQIPAGLTKPRPTLDDDDFTIEMAPSARRVTIAIQPAQRRGPDAKAILHMSNGSSGHAPSKIRQAWLNRAGKPSRQQNHADITETHCDFAGKAFNHADMRNSHGGARPAGQKQGREATINQAQLDAMIRQKHQQQIIAIARKKEEEWGRGRALPDRRQTDVEELVQMSIEADQRTAEREEDDGEDEDEEDDDFAPDDASDGEINPAYSGEEDNVAHSGEEDVVEAPDEDDEEEAGSRSGSIQGTDKENESPSRNGDQDDQDELAATVKRSKSRASPTLDSDDAMDKTPKVTSSRLPLGEVAVLPQLFATRTPDDQGLDLAGFGSGGGSPGFSQLFEETQANNATLGDGFGRLRQAGAAGLLPSQALLPGIDISATQAERDNALVAAEVEAVMMADIEEQSKPKELYLNDRGLFTQTRPETFAATARSTGSAGERELLGGRSEISISAYDMSTPAHTDEGSRSDPPLSPTQDDKQHSSDLKRRSSVHLDLYSSPTKMKEQVPVQRNAFDALMAARRPKEPKGPKRRSDLVDEQAEESDEDNGWGLVGGPEEDEDEDDEGYVPGLVDDQNIDEDKRKRQNELAVAKAREVEQADDARREAQARKIVAGETRQKRKGRDFLDSDEDDDEDEEKRRKRMARRMRKRKRQLGKEDGLDRLEGEENAFKMAYEEGLDSDDAEFEESEETIPQRQDSPEPIVSNKEIFQMLRKRGEMNRGRDPDSLDDELDRDIGFDGAGFGASRGLRAFGTTVDLTEDVEMEESQFSIARSVRTVTTSITLDEDQTSLRKTSLLRNTESYAEYVKSEAQITRRAGGGVTGVSVVSNRSSGPAVPTMSKNSGHVVKPPLRKASSSSSGGSILMSKNNRFG